MDIRNHLLAEACSFGSPAVGFDALGIDFAASLCPLATLQPVTLQSMVLHLDLLRSYYLQYWLEFEYNIIEVQSDIPTFSSTRR